MTEIKYVRGSNGDHIVDLQYRLVSEGFELPRFGADGDLGEEVVVAIESWATDVGIFRPDIVGHLADQDLDYLAKLFILYNENNKKIVHDLRLIRLKPERKHVKGLRQWKDIDSIVLHQTGCIFQGSPFSVWNSVPIHVAVPRRGEGLGKFVKVNDLQAVLWHAQGFNKNSIGIEIEGNFCGIAGDLRTHWKKGGGPHELLAEQVAAARAAVRWITKCAEASGSRISYIYAHRQSSGDRIADPGQAIWTHVGRWAIDQLGLFSGGVNYHIGNGAPIPDAWTDVKNGIGYW